MSGLPKNLLGILSWYQAWLLWWHLCNENDNQSFGVTRANRVYLGDQRNTESYPERVIYASIRAIANGTAHPAGAFTPFCSNMWRRRSRWAAIRIVSVDGDIDYGRRTATKTFSRAQELSRGKCCVLEQPARNAWQVWVISKGYRPWSELQALTARVVSDADVDRPALRHRVFPPSGPLTSLSSWGLAAIGAWDPALNAPPRIIHHNLDTFVRGLGNGADSTFCPVWFHSLASRLATARGSSSSTAGALATAAGEAGCPNATVAAIGGRE